MRITNKMVTRQYIHSLNRSAIELNRLNLQVTSGRKYMRASEDTSSAIQAFRIRKDMSRIEGYQANITHAKASLTNAESALSQVEESVKTAIEKIILGLNGPQSETERAIIAKELRTIQDQVLQLLNSTASDSYYFGGTNTEEKPFTIDASGNLCYNGQNLNLPSTPGNEALFKALEEDSLFLDIGLNMQFDPVTGEIDRSTAFGYSVPGITVMGRGLTNINGEDIPNNLYNLLGAIADEFESDSYTYDRADALFAHFKDVSRGVMRAVTEIGAKTSYLDFMSERMKDQTFNLEERQLEVEGVDPAATIIKFESQRFAYNAALQMGVHIIQPSIFDYMR